MKPRTRQSRRLEALVLLAIAVCGSVAMGMLIWTESNPSHKRVHLCSITALAAIGIMGAALGFWRFAIKGERVPKTFSEIREYWGLDDTNTP
jgi:hypothetical protein